MKRWIASTIVAASCIWPTLASAENTSTKYPLQMVTDETAVLRKGATTSYPIVASIPIGRSVTVIDAFTNRSGEKWYRIDTGQTKGWVPAGALKYAALPNTKNTVAASQRTSAYQLSITVSVANVRQNPSTNAKVVAQLKKGTALKAVAVSTDAKGAKWYKVTLPNKQTGWVHETVVKVTALSSSASLQGNKTYQLSISASAANVRQSPSTSAKVLMQLKKGTALTATAVSTDAKGAKWYKVTLPNKQTGWVHETVVTVGGNASTPPAAPPASTNKKTIITNSALLYADPSLKALVVEKLQKNSQVTVVETDSDSLFNWLKVTSPSGATGWIPEFETNSATEKYVYSKTNAVPLRRGASEAYKTLRTLNANERLLWLYSHNEWLYVETVSGVRGWVLKDSTSSIAVNSLVQPRVATSGKDQYIEWTKTSNFKVSYSVLSDNRLKITGTFAHAEIPNFPITGIQSVEHVNSSVIITFAPGYTFTIRNYSDRLSIRIMERGLKGKRIIIDAGHGGHDTGAIGPTGLREKDINLDTALLLKTELEKAGAIVTLTRSKDVFLELSERTAIANNSNYDAFVSIHTDSFSRTSSGTTTYYNVSTNFNGPKSKILAQYVQKNLVGQLGTPNRGYKEQEFYVNRKNELPSVLVELAFVSNPKEEALLKTKAFRQKAAVGIRQGLEEYFNNF